MTDDQQSQQINRDLLVERMDQADDPIAQQCKQCGNRQFNDQIGPQPVCNECQAFMKYAEDWQVRLFYERQKQTIRHEQGEVTVGGYIESVHGGDQ